MFLILKRKNILKSAGVCALVVIAWVVSMFSPVMAPVFSTGGKRLPVYGVERNDRKIAISFDAAWGDEKTLGILDILDRYQIKTTFFVVGFFVDRYPDKILEIDRRGHEIGNHSSSHPQMSQLSKAQVIKELSDTGVKIHTLTKKPCNLFRPPFGDYNNQVIEAAEQIGYLTIQWDVDSLDWKEQGVTPLINNVIHKVKNGSIVLFHNNSRDILEALPTILDTLLREGYEIVPISQLVYRENYTIDVHGIQKPLTGGEYGEGQ